MISGHVWDYHRYGVITVRDGGDLNALPEIQKRLSGEKGKYFQYMLRVWPLCQGEIWPALAGMYLQPEGSLAKAVLEDFRPGMDHVKIVNRGVKQPNRVCKETSHNSLWVK
jgi:hypothetical protein